MEKIVAGLDIGTSKVCVVLGTSSQHDFNKMKILGYGSAVSDGVSRGMIVNVDKAAVAVKQALQAAEEDSGISINIVNVSVSGKHLTSSYHRGSITRESIDQEITVEDIRKLTNDMYRTVIPLGTEILHVIPQEYTIDNEIITEDPVGMSGIKLEADFHIITAKTHAMQSIHKCIKKAGIEADIVMSASLAASLAVLSEEEKEAGVCLIDFGASLVNIVIIVASIVRYTAVIPLGGNIITSDIKQSCMVMEKQAELLKKKFGSVEPEALTNQRLIMIPGLRNRATKEVLTSNIVKIMKARLEEIIGFIQEEIIHSGLYEKLIAGVVMTGGSSYIPGIQGLVQQLLGLDTRLGFLDEYLEPGSRKTLQDPSYATAVGLTLAGFKALDYREAYYKSQHLEDSDFSKKNIKKSTSNFSFTRIIAKTKAFLVDDYDNK